MSLVSAPVAGAGDRGPSVARRPRLRPRPSPPRRARRWSRRSPAGPPGGRRPVPPARTTPGSAARRTAQTAPAASAGASCARPATACRIRPASGCQYDLRLSRFHRCSRSGSTRTLRSAGAGPRTGMPWRVSISHSTGFSSPHARSVWNRPSTTWGYDRAVVRDRGERTGFEVDAVVVRCRRHVPVERGNRGQVGAAERAGGHGQEVDVARLVPVVPERDRAGQVQHLDQPRSGAVQLPQVGED